MTRRVAAALTTALKVTVALAAWAFYFWVLAQLALGSRP